jgi:hypothetical protein
MVLAKPDPNQRVQLKWSEQLRIYSPVFTAVAIFPAIVIFVFEKGLEFEQLCVIGMILCLLGFCLTCTLSSKELASLRNRISVQAQIKGTELEKEGDAPLPEVVGSSGIYGIVIGLGISDALANYVTDTSRSIANFFANNTSINQTLGHFTNSTNFTLNSIIPIIQLNLSETFRLAGFLFTIIPFIHGTILMFSKKWYVENTKVGSTQEGETHYFLALIFFIVVFVLTILFYYVALNISDMAFFIFSLWLVMGYNLVWVIIHSKLTKRYLKKQYLVRREWAFLNLNTFAFLSIFLFGFPNLLSLKQIVENDDVLNFLIVVVLFSRTLADYMSSWKDFYETSMKLK